MNKQKNLKIMFVLFLLLFFADVTCAQVSAEDDFFISSRTRWAITGVFDGTYKILPNAIEVHLDNAFIINRTKSPFKILAITAFVAGDKPGQSDQWTQILVSEELEINQQLGLREFLNLKDKKLMIPLKNIGNGKLDEYWLGFEISVSVFFEGKERLLTSYAQGEKGMFLKRKK
jgi:hypothetical protein